MMKPEGKKTDSRKQTDSISLCGVKLFPRIGITAEERSVPQECRADLTIWGNFESAAETDSLDQSIDYCQVLATMQDSAGAREYCLLEALAHEILANVLRTYTILRARIKVRKQPAILITQLDFIEVEMEREPQ